MSPFWILLELRIMQVVMVKIGAMRHAKLQSNPHHKQNKHPAFDSPPVVQPTVSKH